MPTKQQNDEFLRRGGHWYCHYNGSAMSYCLMGQRMAQQLLAMHAGPAKGAGGLSNQRLTNRGDQANSPPVAAVDYQKIFFRTTPTRMGKFPAPRPRTHQEGSRFQPDRYPPRQLYRSTRVAGAAQQDHGSQFGQVGLAVQYFDQSMGVFIRLIGMATFVGDVFDKQHQWKSVQDKIVQHPFKPAVERSFVDGDVRITG